jgi:uncharacterized cupredoxin-like copper-binding protein
MKRIALLFIIAFTMIMATACGSPAPAATQAPAQPAATQGAASAGKGTEVDITLADNTIQSSLTAFQVGVPYTFVIKNTGRHAHNFNINQPVSLSGSIDTSLAGALLSVAQNQLPVGGGTTITFTFPDAAAGQQLEFSCLIRQHYEDGMKLAITVTK